MHFKFHIPLVFMLIAILSFPSGKLLGDTVFQVTSLAGNGLQGFENGIGTNSSFAQPNGVAVDGASNVYVADLMNHSVRKVSSNGVVTTLAGNGVGGFRNGNGTNATFWYPSSVAVDRTGSVYVADIYNHTIRRISTNGTVTTLAGKGSYGFRNGTGTNALFAYPMGVAVDLGGNLFVADTDNCVVRKITTNGWVSTVAGSGLSGFSDGDGTNASFSFPQGVAVDRAGCVYVADSGNNSVRKIDTNGAVTTLAGNGTYGFQNGVGTNSSFREPNAITVDADGTVFVTDDNNAIRRVTPDGYVTTVAGSVWGYSDGIGTNASFRYPRGVAVDPSGVLYVSDTDNNSIRKIRSVFMKSAQTIAFAPLPAVTFVPDLQISLTASSSSGLPVVYSSPSSNGTISDSSFTVSGSGTAVIVASQPGDDNYAAAQPLTNTLVIGKASNPITFAAPSSRTFVMGDTLYLAATAPGGTVSFLSGNTNQLAIDGALATVRGAGTVTIKAVQVGSGNYLAATPVVKSLVVNKASQTISFNLPGTTSFSPRGTITLSGVSSSGLPVFYKCSDTSILTISGSNAVMRKKGGVSITAFQAGNANYLGVTNDPVSITLQ